MELDDIEAIEAGEKDEVFESVNLPTLSLVVVNVVFLLIKLILIKIFKYLGVGDLFVANLVCQKWREAGAIVLENRITVMATEDFNPGIEVFMNSSVHYKHWVFKNTSMNYKGSFELNWNHSAPYAKSLLLNDVDVNEQDFVSLVGSCYKLEHLCLIGFSHMFMTGTFLKNDDDLNLLKKSLKSVRSLRLSCSRYLTDCIFSRITSALGSLEDLCLAGCQISYQNSIWKRFYPSDGSVKASEHVFTFNRILDFIQKNKDTLKNLSLGRTSIDSESLCKLSEVPGLSLTSLHLMACDQLTKGGIQLLTMNQKALTDLDISLCSRITDYAVLAIVDNLPRLKALSIRRCQGVTEAGVEALVRLAFLEKLDISHLSVCKWESFHVALGKLKRPMMHWLNVASLPLQWETVEAIATTLPNLKHLDLSMCVFGVNDRNVQALCHSMVHLELLNLSGCVAVSDIGLSGHGLGRRHSSMPKIRGTQLSLETLGLRDKNPFRVPLGSKEEQAIRQEAEVRQYLQKNIEMVFLPSDRRLSHLAGLKELNLCGCLKITDLTLCYAIQFLELTYLNLSHCQQVTEEGLIQVCLKCPSIESLLLTECTNTSDHVVLVIAHRLRRIKTLDLQRCSLLTNDALDSLSNCRTLRYLDVSGCELMTLEQVGLMRSKIPRLLNVHHRGIESSASRDPSSDYSTGESREVPTPPPLLSKLVRKLTR